MRPSYSARPGDMQGGAREGGCYQSRSRIFSTDIPTYIEAMKLRVILRKRRNRTIYVVQLLNIRDEWARLREFGDLASGDSPAPCGSRWRRYGGGVSAHCGRQFFDLARDCVAWFCRALTSAPTDDGTTGTFTLHLAPENATLGNYPSIYRRDNTSAGISRCLCPNQHIGWKIAAPFDQANRPRASLLSGAVIEGQHTHLASGASRCLHTDFRVHQRAPGCCRSRNQRDLPRAFLGPPEGHRGWTVVGGPTRQRLGMLDATENIRAGELDTE